MYQPWFDDYQLFRDQVIDEIGERPDNHTLDRINNKGHYEPGNIRWATRSTQQGNRDDYVFHERKNDALPRWVQKTRSRYRAGFTYHRMPYRGITRNTPEEAYQDALQMREEIGAPINPSQK